MISYNAICVSSKDFEPESWWIKTTSGYEHFVVANGAPYITTDLNQVYTMIAKYTITPIVGYPSSIYHYIVREVA